MEISGWRGQPEQHQVEDILPGLQADHPLRPMLEDRTGERKEDSLLWKMLLDVLGEEVMDKEAVE